VSDKDSFQMTRRLAKEEGGLLVGGSCGMAVVGALEVAKRLGPEDVVVVLLPDSGRGYLSKIFNDEWMADYGFLEDTGPSARVADVLNHKEGRSPTLVHMHPEETVGEAIDVLREYGVSQMPIVKPGAGHPDVMAAEVIGSVVERELLNALFAQRASLSDPLEKHMSPPLPQVGSGEPV
ncbi:CBS domain-containing protein, partial [Streptomyces sp. SID7803]|nr:CBS domain-containing protein [Streptomyces sp. SID7803]